jgi:hypothetical protein
VVLQKDLGAAVLSLADVRASRAQRLVAEGRRRDANAVDVTGRHPDGADETHEKRVDVGALAAEVPCLEHHPDVADAAAAHLGLAIAVGENPVVATP